MFFDTEEIEDNIRACGRLLNQVLDKDLEQEQVYEQMKSYLDTEESKEGYGQWKSDPVFIFFSILMHHFQIFILPQILKLINHFFLFLKLIILMIIIRMN
jgi:hypothetical protein